MAPTSGSKQHLFLVRGDDQQTPPVSRARSPHSLATLEGAQQGCFVLGFKFLFKFVLRCFMRRRKDSDDFIMTV